MFTEKKVSGKYDGEVKLIWGMALHSQLGRGRLPQTARKKATRPWLCFGESQTLPGTLNHAVATVTAPRMPSQVRLPISLFSGAVLSVGLPTQLEFTYLLEEGARFADLRFVPLPPVPSPEAPESLAGLGQGLPTALLSDILTKGPGLSQAPQV